MFIEFHTVKTLRQQKWHFDFWHHFVTNSFLLTSAWLSYCKTNKGAIFMPHSVDKYNWCTVAHTLLIFW